MGRNTRGKSTSEDGSGLKTAPAVRRKTQDGDLTPGATAPNINKGNKTSDEINTKVVVDCNLCAEEVDEDQKSVMCQKCNRWTHQSCANLNNQEMKALEKGRHNITVLSLINAPGALQYFKRGMFIRGKFSMQKCSV